MLTPAALRGATPRAACCGTLVDQLVSLDSGAAARLDQLKRLFKEAVVALLAIAGDLEAERCLHPGRDTRLKLQGHLNVLFVHDRAIKHG